MDSKLHIQISHLFLLPITIHSAKGTTGLSTFLREACGTHIITKNFPLEEFNHFDKWQEQTNRPNVTILLEEYSVYSVDNPSGIVNYSNPASKHVPYSPLLSAIAYSVYLLRAERHCNIDQSIKHHEVPQLALPVPSSTLLRHRDAASHDYQGRLQSAVVGGNDRYAQKRNLSQIVLLLYNAVAYSIRSSIPVITPYLLPSTLTQSYTGVNGTILVGHLFASCPLQKAYIIPTQIRIQTVRIISTRKRP